MHELGKRNDASGNTRLTRLPLQRGNHLDSQGRPIRMLCLSDESQLVAGVDWNDQVTLYACSSLDDMQYVWDKALELGVNHVTWYVKRQEVDSTVLQVNPIEPVIRKIVNLCAPRATEEVQQAIMAYALGFAGTARVLAQQAKTYSTATQVEELVGWPLHEHTQHRVLEIWRRFTVLSS